LFHAPLNDPYQLPKEESIKLLYHDHCRRSLLIPNTCSTSALIKQTLRTSVLFSCLAMLYDKGYKKLYGKCGTQVILLDHLQRLLLISLPSLCSSFLSEARGSVVVHLLFRPLVYSLNIKNNQFPDSSKLAEKLNLLHRTVIDKSCLICRDISAISEAVFKKSFCLQMFKMLDFSTVKHVYLFSLFVVYYKTLFLATKTMQHRMIW
jgi:hypothetical protein